MSDTSTRQLRTRHILPIVVLGLLPTLFALIAWLNGVPMNEPLRMARDPYVMAVMFKSSILSAAILIGVLCFLEFMQTGRLIKPLLAAPLLAGGVMEAMQVAVVTGWLPTTAPLEVYIPMAWVVAGGIVVLYLTLLPTVFLITDTIRGHHHKKRAAQWVFGLTSLLIAASAGLLYAATETPPLQQVFTANVAAARTLSWLPVVFLIPLALFILPTYSRWHPSVFGQTVWLACLPLGLGHAHLALDPMTCCGWNLLAANSAKLIGYLLPCIGLVLDYRWTYQSMVEANQALRDELFMATQLQESSRNHERHLETLFETLRVPIGFLDTSSRLVQINAMTAKVCGLASPRLAVGRTPRDVLPDGLGDLFDEGIDQVLASGDTVRLSRAWMSGDDSSPAENLQWTFQAIRDTRDRTIGILVVGSESRDPAVV